MRPFFWGLVTGVALTLIAGWYVVFGRENEQVQRAQSTVGAALHQAFDTMEAKLDAFELRGKDIKDDIAHTGQVVRQRARSVSTAISDATTDARITTTLKAKLIADKELTGWKIDVNTSAGLVTLSGTVSTHDQIGRAMLLALETPGVQQVSSTLQVKQ